jgi:hypothetical protein
MYIYGQGGRKEIYNQQRMAYGRMKYNAEFMTFKKGKYE